MSFDRVNVSGWGVGEKLTSAQANQLDINVSNAADTRTGYTATIAASWLFAATAVFTGLAHFGATLSASGAANFMGDVKFSGPVSIVGTATVTGMLNIPGDAFVPSGGEVRVATGGTLTLDGGANITRSAIAARLPIAFTSNAGELIYTGVASGSPLLSSSSAAYVNVVSCLATMVCEPGDVLMISGMLRMSNAYPNVLIGVHVTEGGVERLVTNGLVWHHGSFDGNAVVHHVPVPLAYHTVATGGACTVRYKARREGAAAGAFTVYGAALNISQWR